MLGSQKGRQAGEARQSQFIEDLHFELADFKRPRQISFRAWVGGQAAAEILALRAIVRWGMKEKKAFSRERRQLVADLERERAELEVVRTWAAKLDAEACELREQCLKRYSEAQESIQFFGAADKLLAAKDALLVNHPAHASQAAATAEHSEATMQYTLRLRESLAPAHEDAHSDGAAAAGPQPASRQGALAACHGAEPDAHQVTAPAQPQRAPLAPPVQPRGHEAPAAVMQRQQPQGTRAASAGDPAQYAVSHACHRRESASQAVEHERRASPAPRTPAGTSAAAPRPPRRHPQQRQQQQQQQWHAAHAATAGDAPSWQAVMRGCRRHKRAPQAAEDQRCARTPNASPSQLHQRPRRQETQPTRRRWWQSVMAAH